MESYNHDLTKDRFADELRLKHRDGSYRWVVSRGRIVRNDQGEPIRIVGAIGDMTDRLESAARLAASEKRLRDVLDSLYGFVGLYTLEGRVMEANRAPLEAAGRKWRTHWASSRGKPIGGTIARRSKRGCAK